MLEYTRGLRLNVYQLQHSLCCDGVRYDVAAEEDCWMCILMRIENGASRYL